MNAVIVGVGRMGRRHIAAAKRAGLEIDAIADASEESLALARQEHPLAGVRTFTDAAAMLAEVRAEVVIVSTTAPTHCDYVCQAAAAGARYVLCEKPMAVSLAECDRMLDACRRAGTRLAVNHQMRFMEQYTAPKAIVASEAFGGLSSMTVATGNFGLAMNGVHYFEAFRFMADERPRRVTAWFSSEPVPNPRGPQFADHAGTVRLETASGKRFYLDCGADQGHGMAVIYAGRAGLLIVDELVGTMSVAVREAQYRALPTTRYGMPAEREQRTIAPADAVAPTADVLRALVAGRDYPTGEDGRLAQAVLVAAYLSHENDHAPIDLERSELPLDRIFPWA